MTLFRFALTLGHHHTWTGCTFSFMFSWVIIWIYSLQIHLEIIGIYLLFMFLGGGICPCCNVKPCYTEPIVFVFQELYLSVMVGPLDQSWR